MKKKLKRVLAWIAFIITGSGEKAEEAVEAGICDYSGQGRNKYGK